MVRLFHRENECYVCAEGSFSDVPKKENECYTGAPEESCFDGDMVQLFHPENDFTEKSSTGGGGYFTQ